jgi:hypothetical protein
MIKIINGKRYDTEKAKCIADYSNGCISDIFHYYHEALYVTSKGNYFIHGAGGAMSKYSVSVGSNQYEGSQDIIPMSHYEAFVWAQGHATPEALEHFSDLIEEA